MNVSLPPKLEQLAQRRVRSGLYSSPSEVVREALRQMFDLDEAYVTQQLEEAATHPDQPLTSTELYSVRQQVANARAAKTAKKASVSRRLS